MMRPLLLVSVMLFAVVLNAQTHFYIETINVSPATPTTLDEITIGLIGNLSSTGAYISSASANVSGAVVTVDITAVDNGGATVLVPHTEWLTLGFLPAGAYSIVITGTFVGDFAPQDDHFFTVVAGDSCDDLDILSVQWNAFSDSAIMVHASNMNMIGELFDYPNFILFNDNGDTLAKETTNFFGIGTDNWHVLRVMNGVTVPSGPFNGRLELWTLFTTELACTWEQVFDLCPGTACSALYPNLQNFGGALVIGSFTWTLFDEQHVQVGTGLFEMTDVVQYDFDTVCLPPGNYSMEVEALQPPSGGGPHFGVSATDQFTGPNAPLIAPAPPPLFFDFFERCISGTNGVISNSQATGLSVTAQNGSVTIHRMDGSAVGPIDIHDISGRLLYQGNANTNTVTPALPVAASGILVIRAGGGVLRTVLLDR